MSFYNTFKNYLRSLHPGYYKKLDNNKVYIKYVVGGGAAALIDLGLLYVFTDILHIWYLYSASLAFLAAFFAGFYLQKFWTFRDSSNQGVHRQMALYFAVGAVNLGVNTGGMYILVERFNFVYMLSQITVGALIAVSSFLIYKFVIFKKHKIEPAAQNNKLRILLATGIYPPDIGGPATYTEMLYKALPEFGCEVKIATYGARAGGGPRQAGGVYRISRQQSVLLRYLKYFWRVWKISKRTDVIYAFDIMSSGLPCALVRLPRFKTKLVIRLGGDFFWEKAYNNGLTNKPLSAYYGRPKKTLKERIFMMFNKFVLGRCDKIIFSTDWQRDIYKKYFDLREEKIAVINNAFPKVGERHNFSKREEGDRRILFAGRLIRLKNLDRVFQAIKNVKGVKLDIVGEGPEKNNLIKTAEAMGISHLVDFLPGMPRDKLFEKILKSYLVIAPSVSEVSPHIALECVKLHTPVLITRECGFYNKYKNKLIFIDPFNVDDIKEKIEYLLNEDNYRNYIDSIKSVDSGRNFSNVIKEHINLFKELKK